MLLAETPPSFFLFVFSFFFDNIIIIHALRLFACRRLLTNAVGIVIGYLYNLRIRLFCLFSFFKVSSFHRMMRVEQFGFQLTRHISLSRMALYFLRYLKLLLIDFGFFLGSFGNVFASRNIIREEKKNDLYWSK